MKRSSAHLWTAILGFLLGIMGLTFAAPNVADSVGWAWREGAYPGVAGLVLLALSPVVWWIGRRRSEEISAAGARLVRFESSPESLAKWVFLRWFFLGFALLSSAGAALHLLKPWLRSTPFMVGDFFVALICATFFWTVFIASRGWRDRARSRNFRESEIQLEGSYPQILAGCSKAISAIGARVTGLDLEHGLIRARTASSLRSVGEQISFLVQEVDEGLYSIRLESDCVSPFQIWDWGKNAANLRTAVEALIR